MVVFLTIKELSYFTIQCAHFRIYSIFVIVSFLAALFT